MIVVDDDDDDDDDDAGPLLDASFMMGNLEPQM